MNVLKKMCNEKIIFIVIILWLAQFARCSRNFSETDDCQYIHKVSNTWQILCPAPDDGWIKLNAVNRKSFSIYCKFPSSSLYNLLPKLGREFFNKKFSLEIHRPCELPQKFSNITDLFPPITKLYLTILGIKEIPEDFFDNSSCQTVELDLHKNKLKNFSGNVFLALERLERIDLSFNPLQILQANLFIGNKNLKQFILNSNKSPLRLLDGLFSNNKFLTNVQLAKNGNQLEIGAKTFGNSSKLDTLDLSGSVTKIDE